jgi:hypothetical protein
MDSVSNYLLAQRLPIVVALKPAKIARPTKRGAHDPEARSGPAAEAASVSRSEQISRLSRAW